MVKWESLLFCVFKCVGGVREIIMQALDGIIDIRHHWNTSGPFHVFSVVGFFNRNVGQ